MQLYMKDNIIYKATEHRKLTKVDDIVSFCNYYRGRLRYENKAYYIVKTDELVRIGDMIVENLSNNELKVVTKVDFSREYKLIK